MRLDTVGEIAVLAVFMLASLGCQAVGGDSPPVVRDDSAPKSSAADIADGWKRSLADIADGWNCSREPRWEYIDTDRGVKVIANNTAQPSSAGDVGTLSAIMHLLVFSNSPQDDQALRVLSAELAKNMCSECFGNERAEYMSKHDIIASSYETAWQLIGPRLGEGPDNSDVPRNVYGYGVHWHCKD